MKFFYSFYHLFLALWGAFLFRCPSKDICVIGVTGTKGKSTTLALLKHIFSYAGLCVARVTSTHIQIGSHVEKNMTGNSMPGRFFLQRFLYRAKKSGCAYAFIEVTSEGIAQHRHRYIHWDDAVFLGIHPEHIERHGSFEKYLFAKVSFFSYAARFSSKQVHFFAYAHDPHTHLFVDAAKPYDVSFFSDPVLHNQEVSLPNTLLGDFNRINVAAAIAVAHRHGISDEYIQKAIRSFPGLLGRMTVVSQNPVYAVVDYAHTPDSLRAVYQFLKQEKIKNTHKLICVLGACGGGRDVWKRSHFGSIAGSYCDTIILTNEDPYDEDPRLIIQNIQQGVFESSFSGQLHIIEDRAEAIGRAVSCAQSGDVLVCTGKGSEPWIRMKNGRKIPWSEVECVRTHLESQKKI